MCLFFGGQSDFQKKVMLTQKFKFNSVEMGRCIDRFLIHSMSQEIEKSFTSWESHSNCWAS